MLLFLQMGQGIIQINFAEVDYQDCEDMRANIVILINAGNDDINIRLEVTAMTQ